MALSQAAATSTGPMGTLGLVSLLCGEGRANARNWQARQRATLAAGGPLARPVAPVVETTAQAIATPDAQFPWLSQAEQRALRR